MSKQKQGHPRFHELLAEAGDLHAAKGEDYASDADPVSNLRHCEEFHVPAVIGVMVRMSDKWHRLVNLMGKWHAAYWRRKIAMIDDPDTFAGETTTFDTLNAVKGETVFDTLNDLAAYCYLEIILAEEFGKLPKRRDLSWARLCRVLCDCSSPQHEGPLAHNVGCRYRRVRMDLFDAGIVSLDEVVS